MTEPLTTNKTKTYFISDLHLGAGYIADPKAHERKIIKWIEEIAPTAKRLFLLGDVMDYWYEYRNVAPRGFVRFLGALGRLADSGTEIAWFRGNHDIWIFDYLPSEIGLTVYENLTIDIDGHLFYLAHGDGEGKIANGYRLMRKIFRNRFCQWLYAAIHPRWTIAFAGGWSKRSRKQSKDCNPEVVAKEMTRLSQWAEATNAMRNEESLPPIEYFIFGHLHCPSITSIDKGKAKLVVLGEAFKLMSYAEWDGIDLELKTIK